MIITCEHGGIEVPELYKKLFSGHDELLQSHRGWDPGALDMAKFLSKELNAPLYYTEVTRLLIEANRSLHNDQLYSDLTRTLPESEKDEIKRLHYTPYRTSVEEALSLINKPVNHFSIHSFTPVWFEEIRRTDIGILFDPSRKGEAEIADRLRAALKVTLPDFRVDFNEPYRGTDDGFTTHLRSLFPDDDYRGIEIEINQRFVDADEWASIKRGLYDALRKLSN